MKPHDAVLTVAAGIALVATPTVLHAPSFVHEHRAFVAAAWLPTWDDGAAASLPPALHSGVTEVSPTWAYADRDGKLRFEPPSMPVKLQLANAGVHTIPVVQDYFDGAWQGDRMAAILSNPDTAARHRRAIVDTVLSAHWDGIDIDYEQLPPTAGPAFLAFLAALRDDLHAHGRVLTVAVPARTGDDDPGTLAYSYQALGAVVDELRIMAYDHAWAGSAPGPIAPPDWMRSVVSYAVARVPRQKLMLGLATYGYDWTGTRGTELTAADAVALAKKVHATPVWNAGGGGMTFEYSRHGRRHTVWFQDARSLAGGLRTAATAHLRGIAIWRLGGEDPDMWTTVRAAVGSAR